MSNPCAWCDKESGVLRPEGTSHGICSMHAEIELNKVKRAQIEREIDRCETRVRRAVMAARMEHRMANGRPLPVKWQPAGGKRADQVIFSAGVLIASLGLGILVGVLVCAWRFAQ